MRIPAIYFLMLVAIAILLPTVSLAAADSGMAIANKPAKAAVTDEAAAEAATRKVAEEASKTFGHDEQEEASRIANAEATARIVAEEETRIAAAADKKSGVGVAKQQANDYPGYGSVGGIIMVWKSKVETTGARNQKDVIVYLESAASFPPLTNKLIQMDQRGLVFIPHVMALQKGTSVEFLNNDPEKHNVYFLFDKTGETLDLGTWDLGQSVTHAFNESGHVIILCKLHLEMAAHIIVLDNPYYTHAEIDGDTQKTTYLIDKVPPGEYVLKTWHEKLKMKGGEARIKVEAGKKTKVNIAITRKKYAQ